MLSRGERKRREEKKVIMIEMMGKEKDPCSLMHLGVSAVTVEPILFSAYSVLFPLFLRQIYHEFFAGSWLKIVKTVYASPSREVETTAAYPDICFAIDDFDSTFDAVFRCGKWGLNLASITAFLSQPVIKALS
ncbi:hypothetical protein GOBAR_DD08528 [Gossypium barbadense]|nr:hypothetical protein GOBAR_DD08528 [Gossypium barbadense]